VQFLGATVMEMAGPSPANFAPESNYNEWDDVK